MRLRTVLCLAVLALSVGLPSAIAGPWAQTGGATTVAPSDLQLAQDDRDRRRDRRRRDRDSNSRGGGGDGVYTGGRSRGGDGVYTGGRSRGGDGVYTGGRGNQGTVFCNPQLGCVRDLNITPGAGLGGR
jgi:hypothetical protein